MKKGFTLVEIMIVVAIIGIVIAIAVPGFIRARRVSQARACQANLQRIDGAKEQYAMDNRLASGEGIDMDDLLEPEGELADPYLRDEPTCPAAGAEAEYTVNAVGTAPECPVADDELGHNLASAALPVSEWTTGTDEEVVD